MILAIFAWAGWANWEYRKQAAERLLASAAQGELVAAAAGDVPQYVSPLKGKPAPEFTLQDLNGSKVSLASYKGKAVLINFWATWCGPCKIETPWLIELRNQYSAQGFEILGISTEGDDWPKNDKAGWAKKRPTIAKFVQQMQMPYPVLIDGDSISQRIRRSGRDADLVFCGPPGNGGCRATGTDLKGRYRSQYPQGAGG